MNNLFNDSIQEKYNLIINRLLNTIKAYEISFNELGVLKYELNIILNHTNNLPYIEKLEMVSDFLQLKGVNSYIIRKMHLELCGDLISLKSNQNVDTSKVVYWE